MSTWYELTEDDIDVSEDGTMLEVLYDTDDWGNNYMEIPIEAIERKLKEARGKEK